VDETRYCELLQQLGLELRPIEVGETPEYSRDFLKIDEDMDINALPSRIFIDRTKVDHKALMKLG
jgi:hypothetical protein